MIKKTITYKDFDGNSRTEDFYFHLTEAELTDWEFSIDGGLTGALTRIINSNDNRKSIAIFKEIICKAYGKKSEDGRRFMKSKEILDEFISTQAYSDLYMELASDDDKAAEFVNGVMPEELMAKVRESESAGLTLA